MEVLTFLLLMVLPALAIVAGLHDLLTMKIPNWIPGLLVVGFFPAALAVGLPPMEIAVHVGVALGALAIGAGMFALRWLGGGDAKLMAAACLWLGLSGSVAFILFTGVAGGLFCLALVVARRHLAPVMPFSRGWVAQLMEPKGDIPYGVAIAVGALMAFPAGDLMTRFVGV